MRFDSMRPPACRLLLAAAAVVLLAGPARAGIVNTFDNPGDTAGWNVDRYAPAVFAAGQAGGGRLGVLQHGISAADQASLRPPAFSGAFYNTQGRQFALPAGTISAQVELYVPANWNGLNQNVAGAEGRLASFWATAVNAANATSGFPILEFNNNTDGAGADGFRVWDGANWNNVAGFGGYDQWYTLGFDVVNGTFRFFVNGSQVFTDPSVAGSVALGNAILQGYNAGNSYNIHWDNFAAGPNAIPEPTTLALFGLGAVGIFAFRRRKAVAA